MWDHLRDEHDEDDQAYVGDMDMVKWPERFAILLIFMVLDFNLDNIFGIQPIGWWNWY